ncbi:hypothetical protein N431DRAFT_501171 [Stipitochalara longipes BDJ]|nr:hypothetical protein N431DRAFT_501171 [Stipitochalara longipes BDJ]
MAVEETTLEWFGATTFRMKTHGLIIFLDTWLERPSSLPSYLAIDGVAECDYIFISHAHFDHLPGADRLAKRTGAIVIGNGETIRVMRESGVPDSQLIAVSGGERLALFTSTQRNDAIATTPLPKSGPSQGPHGPPQPDPSEAVITVHVWPSLHALMIPGNHQDFPETIDTGTVYTESSSHACTLDTTRALTYGLGSLVNMPQIPPMVQGDMRVFVEYLRDMNANKYSSFDGGQLMYNFLLGKKTLLWNGHLGGYEGILREMTPKPDVVILAVAGRANHNGRPWNGSAAEYAVNMIKWIGEPKQVIWCLHDQGAMNPKFINTKAATDLVHAETRSKVVDLKHAVSQRIF